MSPGPYHRGRLEMTIVLMTMMMMMTLTMTIMWTMKKMLMSSSSTLELSRSWLSRKSTMTETFCRLCLMMSLLCVVCEKTLATFDVLTRMKTMMKKMMAV